MIFFLKDKIFQKVFENLVILFKGCDHFKKFKIIVLSFLKKILFLAIIFFIFEK